LTEESKSMALPVPDATHLWFVVHSRPRCEKKVAEFCKSKNIYCYLPQIRKSHRYGNRTRSHEVPLFTGYLFVLVEQANLTQLQRNQRVANVLSVIDQLSLLNQLENIKRALDLNQAVELFPHLTAGMKVMVRSGPLKGVEGFVHKLKSKTRIILNVDFIQQAIGIEVDAEWLVPV